jgi:hypothetical protein
MIRPLSAIIWSRPLSVFCSGLVPPCTNVYAQTHCTCSRFRFLPLLSVSPVTLYTCLRGSYKATAHLLNSVVLCPAGRSTSAIQEGAHLLTAPLRIPMIYAQMNEPSLHLTANHHYRSMIPLPSASPHQNLSPTTACTMPFCA